MEQQITMKVSSRAARHPPKPVSGETSVEPNHPFGALGTGGTQTPILRELVPISGPASVATENHRAPGLTIRRSGELDGYQENNSHSATVPTQRHRPLVDVKPPAPMWGLLIMEN